MLLIMIKRIKIKVQMFYRSKKKVGGLKIMFFNIYKKF